MKQLRLILQCALWMTLFASLTCVPTSTSQIVGESPVRQPSSSPRPATATQSQGVVPSVTPSPEAKPRQPASSDSTKVETKVQPAVIWITVFDAKGNLLRTQSGFFISA